jgi:hypothetical protein
MLSRHCLLGLPLLAASCAAEVLPDTPIGVAAEPLSPSCEKQLPPQLAVPEGNRLAFQFHAEGAQIYTCQTSADSFAWVFTAPDAELFDRHGHQVGTHYAGPTWEANDDSTIVGSKVAEASVDASAIPWLLLKAKSNTGDGLMSNVSYVQRLSTVGGLAPTRACAAANSGEVARVPYSATYAFYTPKPAHKPH